MTYRTQDERLRDLLGAVDGLDLSDDETRLLMWLSGWPPTTTDVIASLLRKARRGSYPGPSTTEGGGES